MVFRRSFTSGPGRGLRVLWVTNLAAPYRLPVWREVARGHELTVGLLESNQGLSADKSANRGADWLHAAEASYRFLELPAWKYSRGEARYYTLRTPGALLRLGRQEVVLFGGWESPAYWQLLLPALLWGARRVGFYESPAATMTHRAGPIARARSFFFRSMHAVVVPGPAARQSLLQMGVSPERIVEGFNAVDVHAFHTAASARTADRSGHGHRFVVAGQLIERKRVDMVIEAFSAIAEPGDTLTIIGQGKQESELRHKAARSGDGIVFLPYVENDRMPAALASHQTLVLASSREVWGLVVNEALAAGLQTVVTENCGVTPSVAGMRGVFTAKADGTDLAVRMLESRQSWTGPIQNPEILQHTPEAFARTFETAFRVAAKIGA